MLNKRKGYRPYYDKLFKAIDQEQHALRFTVYIQMFNEMKNEIDMQDFLTPEEEKFSRKRHITQDMCNEIMSYGDNQDQDFGRFLKWWLDKRCQIARDLCSDGTQCIIQNTLKNEQIPDLGTRGRFPDWMTLFIQGYFWSDFVGNVTTTWVSAYLNGIFPDQTKFNWQSFVLSHLCLGAFENLICVQSTHLVWESQQINNARGARVCLVHTGKQVLKPLRPGHHLQVWRDAYLCDEMKIHDPPCKDSHSKVPGGFILMRDRTPESGTDEWGIFRNREREWDIFTEKAHQECEEQSDLVYSSGSESSENESSENGSSENEYSSVEFSATSSYNEETEEKSIEEFEPSSSEEDRQKKKVKLC